MTHQIKGTDNMVESHVKFWDRDSDGIISPLDVYKGFKELGFNLIISIASMFIICGGFSYVTQESWIPDPLFRIRVGKIHRAKHGSDTGSYDTNGGFVEKNFDDVFTKYSSDGKSLSFTEGLAMIRGNRNIFDPFGWSAALFEWTSSYLLIWPADGRVSRESMRGIYDGTIFFQIAAAEKTRAHSTLSGFYKSNEITDPQNKIVNGASKDA